ncbi:hypothetical protein M2135_000697 [Parabacteroides sp. PF5-9]|nr:hypothetical protein [Parabacteroides sp. PF5-9]
MVVKLRATDYIVTILLRFCFIMCSLYDMKQHDESILDSTVYFLVQPAVQSLFAGTAPLYSALVKNLSADKSFPPSTVPR